MELAANLRMQGRETWLPYFGESPAEEVREVLALFKRFAEVYISMRAKYLGVESRRRGVSLGGGAHEVPGKGSTGRGDAVAHAAALAGVRHVRCPCASIRRAACPSPARGPCRRARRTGPAPSGSDAFSRAWLARLPRRSCRRQTLTISISQPAARLSDVGGPMRSSCATPTRASSTPACTTSRLCSRRIPSDLRRR